MSVLIKGMKMPESCESCPFEDFGGCMFRAERSECPLIEVSDSCAQSEQGWILCSERLPEDDTEVFVYLYHDPSPYIAWIRDSRWYTEDFEVDREYEPLAWMTLPEPYEEHTMEEFMYGQDPGNPEDGSL